MTESFRQRLSQIGNAYPVAEVDMSMVDWSYRNATCAECRHFDAGNKVVGLDGKAKQSKCLAQIHVVGMMAPQGIVTATVHASVPPDFPACGMFVRVEEKR